MRGRGRPYRLVNCTNPAGYHSSGVSVSSKDLQVALLSAVTRYSFVQVYPSMGVMLISKFRGTSRLGLAYTALFIEVMGGLEARVIIRNRFS